MKIAKSIFARVFLLRSRLVKTGGMWTSLTVATTVPAQGRGPDQPHRERPGRV